jgi:hypothetical protein
MRRAGRKKRKGASLDQIYAAFDETGYALMPTEQWLTGATVTKAFKSLSKDKVYVVLIRGHIFTVRNGEPMDWIEPGRRHMVKQVWEVVKLPGSHN